MSAYVFVDIHVHDTAEYEEYKRLAGPTVGLFGGRYIVRGGATEVLEGRRSPNRVVILEFPSVEAARRWWNSEEYAPAKLIRQRCAATEMILVEGVKVPE